MFTYREFADGAHDYRQSVAKHINPRLDEDYEVSRSQNELSVINLSRIHDYKDLTVILTYMDSLIKALDLEAATSFEDCLKLSVVLSYYKIIGQECQLAITLLDKIYAKIRIDYEYSGGGLIFTMYPHTKFQEFLPYVRAKIPITASPGRTRTIIHEYFVALVALNPLRRFIPSFAYVYSYWHCGLPIVAEGALLGGLCDTNGSRPMMVYEDNPGAITLFNRMRVPDSQKPGLTSILSYLLQLMGALQLASDYANYTHYDLHSGNVLVQDIEDGIEITFQEYKITSNERIIIIDNGLAFCSYEKPASLAPLRRAGSTRFPNANAIEIFAGGTEDIERLQATKMRDYGSIQNKLVGVQNNRPYPLGDVFRIFFDIYSLCSPEVQHQLLPLVNHFFKDSDVIRHLTRDTDTQASSIVNSFSLPPFREELYGYQYRFFGQAILDNYMDILGSFVEVNSTSMVIGPDCPGIKLSETIDWHVRNKKFFPDLYEIGITYMLDKDAGRALADKGVIVPSKQETLDSIARHQRRIGKLLNITDWYDIKEGSVSVELMLNRDFYRKFSSNIDRCVNCVQWARTGYSNFRVIHEALKALNVVDPLPILAGLLNIRPRDLSTFADFCKTFTASSVSRAVFSKMLRITQRIEAVMEKLQMPRLITKENSLLNWYRATLPSIRIHLEFCVDWGGRPAIYGELSLPSIG